MSLIKKTPLKTLNICKSRYIKHSHKTQQERSIGLEVEVGWLKLGSVIHETLLVLKVSNIIKKMHPS